MIAPLVHGLSWQRFSALVKNPGITVIHIDPVPPLSGDFTDDTEHFEALHGAADRGGGQAKLVHIT
jgi:hypothetical protein